MKLPTISRMLILLGALSLGGMYVLPLWRIELGAPQYPEGLGLVIRINTIAGQKPHDLANINGLNHYIGMRPIEPDAIPELIYMPWILGGLIAFGVATAIIARRRMLWAWLATMVMAGVAGLYDFWRWGYDYGHNLDEAAAIIKVPGMTYSPPVIGTKTLLNFTATSLPDAGAYLAALAFVLGAVALWLAYRGATRQASSTKFAERRVVAATAAAAVLLTLPLATACTTSAAPLRYGEDECAQCRMVITDPRFGGSVVTAKGRTAQFDSIDCLLGYVATLPDPPRTVLVANFLAPGSMLDAETAVFVHHDGAHGPMGTGWIALARGAETQLAGVREPSRTFADLLASVNTEPVAHGTPQGAGAGRP